MSVVANPGLEGIVATATRLSHVDGEAGVLLLAGFPVEEIAPRASFEEMIFLLEHGRLPSAAELAELAAELAARRALAPEVVALLAAAATRRAPVMDALRMGAAALGLGAPRGRRDEGLTAIAAFPTLVGTYWRLLQGLSPVAVREDLGHAAHYLHQVFGVEPAAETVRGIETYLATVIDHGLNASTFAARVIVSTGSDLLSAIVGAVGALKGPLHGGAPGPALDLVLEIGSLERAEPVLRAKLAAGERLMGFGHRVYRVRDPRAEVLAQAAARFYATEGDAALYELARGVEAVAQRLLREHKPDRKLDTNVEYYTALLLHGLGLPNELFTPTFAVGRVAGWAAHCLEQIAEGRLIRPASAYVGPRPQPIQGLTLASAALRAASNSSPGNQAGMAS